MTLTLKEVFMHEEEAVAGGSKYPPTAEEYAKQLNAETDERGNKTHMDLVTDPEHWSEFGVYSGEDLARYIAVEDHWNLYKEINGIRPRHMDYDGMSIEEIESETAQLEQQWADEMNDADDTSWSPSEYDSESDEMDDLLSKQDRFDRVGPNDGDPKARFSMHDDEFEGEPDETEMLDREQENQFFGSRGF